MITKTEQERILNSILRNALNNLEVLYDFENTTDKEFKECYGYTKKQIKGVLTKNDN
jgi:hypothetical protein